LKSLQRTPRLAQVGQRLPQVEPTSAGFGMRFS
jgi:hypothetical protein